MLYTVNGNTVQLKCEESSFVGYIHFYLKIVDISMIHESRAYYTKDERSVPCTER